MANSTKTEHYVARQEGGRVYYDKQGQGEPLVFVGGHDYREKANPEGGKAWMRIIDKMSQHFTCYAIDLPGFDRSDIPRSWIATRKWTLHDYTSAVLETLDGIGLKQSSFLGDHTTAMVALDIAANQPQRVKKLVLDCLPYWNLERGIAVWERWFHPMHTDTTSYDVPVQPLLPPYEEMKKKEPALTREEWKERDETKRRNRRWSVVHEYVSSHFDTEALGPKAKAPTLLVYGEREILRRGEQRANEGIKGSILKIITDCPREGVATGGTHQYKPEEFTKLALDFLLDRK